MSIILIIIVIVLKSSKSDLVFLCLQLVHLLLLLLVVPEARAKVEPCLRVLALHVVVLALDIGTGYVELLVKQLLQHLNFLTKLLRLDEGNAFKAMFGDATHILISHLQLNVPCKQTILLLGLLLPVDNRLRLHDREQTFHHVV